MTSQYINPLAILALADTNADSIKKAKRRKLMEFDLSDDGTIEINGKEISKNDFLTMAELLDTPENIEFFALLKNELHLLEAFLSLGELDFFKNYKPQPIFKRRDFQQFVRPFYLPQLSKTLVQAYKDNNTSLLKQLFKPSEFVAADNEDAAYTALYQHINQQIKTLEELLPAIKKEESKYNIKNLNTIYTTVNKSIKPDALNLLPTYFQSQRNNIALTINQIGAATFNKHELFETPLQLLALAKKLQIDKSQQQTLDENIEQLETMQAEENEQEKTAAILAEIMPIINLVISLDEQLENRKINPISALSQLILKFNFSELNALPTHLPSIDNWRDKIALRILSMSVESYNKYDDADTAQKIILFALQLNISSTAQEKIQKAYANLIKARDKDARQILELLNNINRQLRSLGHNETANTQAIDSLLRKIFVDEHLSDVRKASYDTRKQILTATNDILAYLSSAQRYLFLDKLALYIGDDIIQAHKQEAALAKERAKNTPKKALSPEEIAKNKEKMIAAMGCGIPILIVVIFIVANSKDAEDALVTLGGLTMLAFIFYIKSR